MSRCNFRPVAILDRPSEVTASLAASSMTPRQDFVRFRHVDLHQIFCRVNMWELQLCFEPMPRHLSYSAPALAPLRDAQDEWRRMDFCLKASIESNPFRSAEDKSVPIVQDCSTDAEWIHATKLQRANRPGTWNRIEISIVSFVRIKARDHL